MWLWLIAVILLVGIWVGGTFLAWPLWLRILLTILVVLMVVGWYVFKRVRATMKARALEREILKQAEQQAMNARPDRRAEILELQSQVQRGLAAMKASKLGGSAGSALYTLPWYVIIGPPGAGKTTALKHSGLVFPFLDPRGGGGVRGIGGTRNCDWWFTNEAILLDTAGRYATESDDHEEWLSFLGMLKKYRSRKPINGVLVAISVTDLMDANEEQIDTFSKKLRARIDEVMTRLQMVVPVYIVFTKVDLVAGFAEFWNDLRKSERAQIWGVTYPLDGADQREPAKAFDAEFDLLVEQVHARALRRIGAERQVEARQKIFQFPIEYQALKQNLSEFIGGLFQKNTFQETPIFRGVYFTSGTQEGRPVDRVIGGMMRAFNISPQAAAAPQPQTESKSYFVTDMFKRVVFPDQHVAGRTKGEIRRQLLNRLAFAAVALFVASLLVIPSIYTFYHNTKLISETRELAAEANKVKWDPGGGNVADKANRLGRVRDRLEDLDKWRDKESPPLKYRWFMYQGDKLYEPLRGVYHENLRKGFSEPTKARLEEELRAVPEAGKLTSEKYNEYFSRLRTYLEVCQWDYKLHLNREYETPALRDAWARALGTNLPDDKAALEKHVDYYLELLSRGEFLPWNCDAKLVSRTRLILKNVSKLEAGYNRLVGDANADVDARITRDKIFKGMAVYDYITSKSSPPVYVDGAYTKYGWEKYVRDRLSVDRLGNSEGWVLGDSEEKSQKETQEQLNALQASYFTNFEKQWVAFLKDLDVRVPASNDDALNELTALSDTPFPYYKLIKTLADNVRLEQPPETFADKAEQNLENRLKTEAKKNSTLTKILGDGGVGEPEKKVKWVSPVEDKFNPIIGFAIAEGTPKAGEKPAPTSLGHYQEQVINKLVGVLSDLRDAKGTAPDATQVKLAFQEAFRSTKELLTSSQNGFTRPILSPLLMNPIQLGYKGVLADVGAANGGKWEAEVWKKWKATLEDKYPFTDSAKDASLEDFNTFFKPKEGLLWLFYEENLKTSLEKNGQSEGVKFIPSQRFGSGVPYKPQFLKCYDRGMEITNAIYPPKSDGPAVRFEVNLHSVSQNVAQVTFEIDGVAKTYKNEPEEWLKSQWPALEPKGKGAKIRVRGAAGLDEEINRPGDFGFFRLLDAANRIEAGTEGGKRGAPPTIVVTWALRSQPGSVKMDVKPSQSENIFEYHVNRRQRIFRDYNCPRVISTTAR